MILASKSPRRRKLLAAGGYTPRVIPADVDETRLEGESPVELVERLAETKARAVADEAGPYEVVVGADTIVWLGDETLGKPADADEAQAMLSRLSGKTHHVTTGVALIVRNLSGEERVRVFSETTDVTFYELTDAEIAVYARSEEPLDKAGAYAVQGGARLFVKGIDGSYDNVVGLPLARFVRELLEFSKTV